jgi:HEAT repeat protein
MNNYIDNSENDAELIQPLREKPSIDVVVRAIENRVDNDIIPQEVYYGLSDASNDQVTQFKTYWDTLQASYRRQVIAALAEVSETDFEFDFRELGLLALKDADTGVREAAIKMLWIDESSEFAQQLMHMGQHDDSSTVRAAACSELGRFILLGEYEEIPESLTNQIQEIIIGIWTDTTEVVEVRRRALEAISNSGHQIVKAAIEEAYSSDEHTLKVSAVFAMGRSLDPRWKSIILTELNSSDSELRFEAARAAGELEIKQSVSQLGHLALTDDREIQEVAIWSLGEISGTQASRILDDLADTAQDSGDDELLEVIEDAIGSARMAEYGFEMHDLDEDDYEEQS